jgi:hypothetical protein
MSAAIPMYVSCVLLYVCPHTAVCAVGLQLQQAQEELCQQRNTYVCVLCTAICVRILQYAADRAVSRALSAAARVMRQHHTHLAAHASSQMRIYTHVSLSLHIYVCASCFTAPSLLETLCEQLRASCDSMR